MMAAQATIHSRRRLLPGLSVGCAFIQSGARMGSAVDYPLAIVPALWRFGSGFSLGAVGTGLALLPYG